MITNKLKSILSLKGLVFADFDRKLGITPQSLQTKAKKDAYKIQDPKDTSQLTTTEQCFVDKDTSEDVLTFNKSDLTNE